MLAGCSTGAQIEADRMVEVATETKVSATTCHERATAKAEYAPLRSKIYFGLDNNMPLELVTNGSRPSKQEISLLYKFHADRQACRKIALEGYSKVHPLLMLTLVEAYTEQDKLWARLVSGGITWGQFNQAMKDLYVQARANQLRAGTQIEAQLQNQHAFEVAQRQRAAAAFQQWAYQQQVLANQRTAIMAANRPQTISCQYVGNTAQCNSY